MLLLKFSTPARAAPECAIMGKLERGEMMG